MLHPSDDARQRLDKLGLSSLRRHSLVSLFLLALRPTLLPLRRPIIHHKNVKGAFSPVLRQSSPCLDLAASSIRKGDTLEEDTLTITIRDVRFNTELQDVCDFLNDNFYKETPNPFARLFGDSFTVPSIRSLLSVVVVVQEREEIIGTLGLSVTALNRRTKKHRRLDNETTMKLPLFDKESSDTYQGMVSDEETVSAQIWNLAVRRSERRRGVARKLLSFVEERLKTSGYPGVHLLVRADNSRAANLYNSTGYRLEWSKSMGVLERQWGFIEAVEKVDVFCMGKNVTHH